MVFNDFGVQPEEVLMVAAHARDLPGMKNVGLRTDFIEQPETTLYPNVAKPDFVLNDLLEFVKRLRSEILYKKRPNLPKPVDISFAWHRRFTMPESAAT